MPATTTRLSAALLLLPLLIAAPAGARTKAAPDLRAMRLTAPTSAHAGGPLPVRLVVASAARLRRAAGVRVYLSSDRRRSKDDVRLAASGRVPAMRAGRAAVGVDAQIPAGRTGTLRVLACADDPGRLRERRETNNCAVAPAAVVIAAHADPSRSSSALIAADLAAGKLSAEKALLYRVYAVFGDERLPARYAGDAGAAPDDLVMRDVAAAWRTMSGRTRRLLAPFTLRPSARGSWFSRQDAPVAKSADPGDEYDPCLSQQFTDPSWQNSVTAAGGKVRIFWNTDYPEDRALAATLATTVNAAWPVYKRIMVRTPISDAGEKLCPHGPDGAIDVYLVRSIPRATGLTIPSSLTKWAESDCSAATSSFIAMEHTSGTFTRPFTLAHELFHAFQNAYGHKGGCFTDAWFDEGSANWAGNVVLPQDDAEHFFTSGLEDPRDPIDDMKYDSWPFMLWMEKTLGEQTIRKTYERFEKQPGMLAVDAAIGGLRQHALDFARHAWNQKPLDPSFVAWDHFPVTPKVDRHEVVQSHLFLAGQHERTANVPVDIQAHARDYRSFTITDDKLRQVTFRNPLAGDPDARIGAILTLRGGATRFEDWSGKDTVRLCRDQPDQDVADIVIVYAASDPRLENGRRMTGNPELALKDECEGLPWRYKILSLSFTSHADGAKTAGAETYCGLVAGRAIHGITDFKGGTTTPEFDPDNQIKLGYGGALTGDIGLRAPAAFAYTLTGCDDEKQYCTSVLNRPVLGDGNWSFGFSVEAESRTAKDATLTWVIADPSVGFVDYDPSVCNVEEIWKGLALADEQQTVALATLEDTKPFTLKFQGDKAWSADQAGKAAVITYDWTYEVKLQRVDEQGRPL